MPISTIKNDGLEGPVPIAKGGTGSTTTTAALNNLLPAQTTAIGKVLQSNGTQASWVTLDALPTQASNSGKYLTTNGANASWAVLTMPDWLAYAQDTKRLINASTATTNIDLQLGDFATFFKVTIAASTTITFTNFPAAASGQVFTFSMMTVNDATAGRTVAFGNTVKWAGGLLPTRTTTANAIDFWTFFYENSILYGSLSVIDAK